MSKKSRTKALALCKEELAEEKALAELMDANDARLPKFEKIEEGSFKVKVDHVGKFSEMFGDTKSTEFATAMLETLANVSGSKEAQERDKSYALAIVAEIEPKDGIEAMLASQMAAVHITSMRQSRLLAGSETIPQFEAHERAFNKLMRTFATQMEVLRKHRHGGRQTVTVQHVNVEDGGQAIVGNVESRGAGRQ